MSWWIGVEIDTGAEVHHQFPDRNVTYNLAPMYYLALDISEPGIHVVDGCRCAQHPGRHEMGLRVLHKAPCTEAAGVISRARARMLAEPNVYKILNPANGWGDYEDAVDSLTWLLNECELNPNAVVYIH